MLDQTGFDDATDDARQRGHVTGRQTLLDQTAFDGATDNDQECI